MSRRLALATGAFATLAAALIVGIHWIRTGESWAFAPSIVAGIWALSAALIVLCERVDRVQHALAVSRYGTWFLALVSGTAGFALVSGAVVWALDALLTSSAGTASHGVWLAVPLTAAGVVVLGAMYARNRHRSAAPDPVLPVVVAPPADGRPNGLILLYDGVCGFCNSAVQFVLARDTTRTMQFAPLQSAFARGVLDRHPELRGVDSMVVVDRDALFGETVLVRWNAVTAVMFYLGGWWRRLASELRLVVPRALGDWVYNAIARRRHRGAMRFERCPLPPTEHRARFIV
jgi:predicted DCC family thiol-disulfide oxidoreductase YuxK